MPDLTVHNPFDQSVVGHVPLADAAVIARAIDVAHSALPKTRAQPPHERAELLLRIAAEIAKQKDELSALIVAEAGKPITLARAEVDRAVITFTSAADEARRWPGETLDASAYAPGAGHIAISKRVPLGVVYGMGPFNFPLNLVAHKLAPAIACGASIILKPSPRTPLSAIKLGQIVNACGAIPGQVQIVVCDNDLALSPLDDPRVRVVSFTGSAAVGWKVKERAIKQKITLELGGNAPVILHDDADIEKAIPMIAAGAFGNAGQSCISIQRVLIHASIYDQTRDALVAYTRQNIRCGDPARTDVTVGPMITTAARDRTIEQIAHAKSEGARVLCGGGVQGPCLEPTLLESVHATNPLCRDEAFAPVAVLMPYDDFAQAITLANDTDYGLQAGVFTRDIGRILQSFHALDFGGVTINQTPTFRIDNLPYGGIKNSGLGREGPRYAMEDFTETKTLVVRQA